MVQIQVTSHVASIHEQHTVYALGHATCSSDMVHLNARLCLAMFEWLCMANV
jgi:hypothetical protein